MKMPRETNVSSYALAALSTKSVRAKQGGLPAAWRKGMAGEQPCRQATRLHRWEQSRCRPGTTATPAERPAAAR